MLQTVEGTRKNIHYSLRTQKPWLTDLHFSAVGEEPPRFSHGDRLHGQHSLRSSPVSLSPGAIAEEAATLYLAFSERYPSLAPVIGYGLTSGHSDTKHSRISVIERNHVSTGRSSRGRRGCDEGEVGFLMVVALAVEISGRFCGR